MNTDKLANAIFDALYEDIAFVAKPDDSAADMLNRLFRYEKVTKIKKVLEKTNKEN